MVTVSAPAVFCFKAQGAYRSKNTRATLNNWTLPYFTRLYDGINLQDHAFSDHVKVRTAFMLEPCDACSLPAPTRAAQATNLSAGCSSLDKQH
jgi:hypothetical protein